MQKEGENKTEESKKVEYEVATFGAGCFWCTEAVFKQIEGVVEVKPGYMGGSVENPTYEQVCTGKTGHAEVAQITYDPEKVSYRELLTWFWKMHDPTTPNRQGNDVGPQYRSVIFYHTEEQRKIAEASRKALQEKGVYKAPIVTQIEPAGKFWPAEKYHWEYYRRNPEKSYCKAVIAPKLRKLGLKD